MDHTFVTAVFLAALVIFALMLAVSLIASREVHMSDFWASVYRASHSKLYVGILVVMALVPAAMNYDNVPVRAVAIFCWGLMEAGWVFSGATLNALVMTAFLSTCVFAIGCFVAVAMDSYDCIKRTFQASNRPKRHA